MYNYQEDMKAKFNGVGARVEFDKIVNERNLDTLRDIPDKEIVTLVYKLRSSTAEQIIRIIGKNFKISESKIKEKIKKVVNLRLITRYKLEYEINGVKKETDNIYMLDVNGKNLIEGEDLQKLEWDQRDNLSIGTHPEIHLKHLITNKLIVKYIEEASAFYSYEIKPRLYFKHTAQNEYIRPDALINLGSEEYKVHFVLYTFRRNRKWKEELLKLIPHFENMYKDFTATVKLMQEPLMMFICEDEAQVKEVCAEIGRTNIPLSYTVYTYDTRIETKPIIKSIAIAKKEQSGKFTLEYPELQALL